MLETEECIGTGDVSIQTILSLFDGDPRPTLEEEDSRLRKYTQGRLFTYEQRSNI